MNFPPAPDRAWLDFLKVIFGYLLLALLCALAAIIGLGKVEQHTSFGLEFILGSLVTLSGGFAQWAFSASNKSEVKS